MEVGAQASEGLKCIEQAAKVVGLRRHREGFLEVLVVLGILGRHVSELLPQVGNPIA